MKYKMIKGDPTMTSLVVLTKKGRGGDVRGIPVLQALLLAIMPYGLIDGDPCVLW